MGWSYFDFARAVRNSSLKGSHRAVLWALALRADQMGSCYPSQETISKDSGVSERQVRRVLDELLEGPLLSAEKSKGRATVYYLHTPDDMAGHPGHHDPPDMTAGGAIPRTPRPDPPDTTTRVPRTPCPLTPDTMADDLPKKRPMELPIEGSPPPPQQLALGPTGEDEPKPQAKPKKKPPPQGSRLPEDWILPRPWGTWALGEGLTEAEVRLEAEKFRDHFIAAPGRHGRKTNWKATWRNWIRKRDEFNHKKRPTQTQGPAAATKTAAEHDAHADRLYQAQLAKTPGPNMGPTQEQLAGFDREAAHEKVMAEIAEREAEKAKARGDGAPGHQAGKPEEARATS